MPQKIASASAPSAPAVALPGMIRRVREFIANASNVS